MAVAAFHCAACGKRFVWKPQSAGKTRVCECGEFVPVPLEQPVALSRGDTVAGAHSLSDTEAGQTAIGAGVGAMSDSAVGQSVGNPSASGAATSGGTIAAFDLLEAPPPANPSAPADDNCYGVKSETPRPGAHRRPHAEPSDDVAPTDDSAGKGHVGQAFLADAEARERRLVFTNGTVVREFILPFMLFVIASSVVGFEIQRHLIVDNATTYVGRALAFYLAVNVVGLGIGTLFIWLTMKVEFGRFLPSLVKWLALGVATPATWVGVLELFLKYQIGGASAADFGMAAGWLTELCVLYALFANLFNIEAMDVFWTICSISTVKVAVFVAFYIERAKFGL